MLAGISDHLRNRLQLILNAAAWLVFSRHSEHITPLLHDLHWLWVPERILFRLCVLMYCCLNSTASSYLAESICQVADIVGRHDVHSLAIRLSDDQPWVTKHSITASHMQNSLPSYFGAAMSLITFQQEHRSCFVDHCANWAHCNISWNTSQTM